MTNQIRRHPLLIGLGLVLVVQGCGNDKPSEEIVADSPVLTDLSSRPTYRAVIDARTDASGVPIDGTYEVEVQRPDKYRAVQRQAGQEVSRTIVVGDTTFVSQDSGKSWTSPALPVATPQRVQFDVLNSFQRACSVNSKGNTTVAVETPSPNRGCDGARLIWQVETSSNVVTMARTILKTDYGTTTMSVQFDLTTPVAPIVPPSSSADVS